MKPPVPVKRGHVARAAVLAPRDAYPAFLGTGWSFPPTFFRQSGSVEMASGEVDIRESLWIILATRLGERTMMPTFGSALAAQVFTGLTTTTANEIAAMVAAAITEWEPRVTVNAVSATQAVGEVGVVEVAIDYTVRQTNSRSNLVFPYHALEATLSPPV